MSAFEAGLLFKGSATLRCCALLLRSRNPALALQFTTIRYVNKSGGGRSQMRTRLCGKIPVNRENYREFWLIE